MSITHDENGRPSIWGKPATWDDREDSCVRHFPTLSRWQCPHCEDHLAEDGHICLNACHLTAPQLREYDSVVKTVAEDIHAMTKEREDI